MTSTIKSTRLNSPDHATTVTTHHFDLRDEKGREVAARIIVTEGVEFVPVPEGQNWGYTREPGRYWAVRCQQTRGGKAFGASQGEKFFDTREELDAHVKKYLRNASRRAEKKWGAA